MTPSELKDMAATNRTHIMGIDQATLLTTNRLDKFLTGYSCDYHEAISVKNKLTQAAMCIRQARMYIREADSFNADISKAADALEKEYQAEAERDSDDDLDGIVEQVKAALASADPGTDVTFVVRKESTEVGISLSELMAKIFDEH